jgi:replicative DNA helicase
MEYKKIQQLPNDLNLEKAVLGAILLEKPAFQDAKNSNISHKDFYHDGHASIYLACQDLYNAGKDIDLLSVNRQLAANKVNIDLGFLMDVTNSVSSSQNLQTHCIELRELAMRRDTHNSAILLSQKALDLSKDIFEVKDEYKSILEQNEPKSNERLTGLQATSSAIRRMLDRRLKLAKGERIGSPTFSKVADVVTQGYEKGEVIIYALPSSHGKSLIASLECLEASKANFKSCYISLEMDDEEIGARWLSMESGISYFRIGKGNVADWQVPKILEAQTRIQDILDNNVSLYSLSELSPKKLEEIIYLESKKGVHNIYLDYIQIVDLAVSYGNTKLGSLNDFTRNLKRLAKKYQVAIIALSQLNREAYASNKATNGTGDIDLFNTFISASSTIENDADKIILGSVFDKWGIKETKTEGMETTDGFLKLVQFKMTKNRGGGVAEWKMWANLGTGQYTDLPQDLENARLAFAEMTKDITDKSFESKTEIKAEIEDKDMPF